MRTPEAMTDIMRGGTRACSFATDVLNIQMRAETYHSAIYIARAHLVKPRLALRAKLFTM